MTVSMDREIGRLSAEVDSLQKQVTTLTSLLASQGDMIREVRDVMVATKGTWKMLVAVAGLAATVSGLVGTVVTWWNMAGR